MEAGVVEVVGLRLKHVAPLAVEVALDVGAVQLRVAGRHLLAELAGRGGLEQDDAGTVIFPSTR